MIARKVRSQLKKVAAEKKKALLRGLLKAGLELQADSQEIVPVEHGELKMSARTYIKNGQVFVAYDDPKAIYVHERVDLAHGAEYNAKHADDIAAGKKFARGPNQQAKFLESPARKNKRKYQRIIAKEVK